MTDSNKTPDQEQEQEPDFRPALTVLFAPEGMTSASWGGIVFNVAKGRIRVPQEAVGDLMSHGFRPAE